MNTGMTFQALCELWSDERLLNIAEQVLGTTEITGNPNWNLRTKTPQNEATTVPWHQGMSQRHDQSNASFKTKSVF